MHHARRVDLFSWKHYVISGKYIIYVAMDFNSITMMRKNGHVIRGIMWW